MKSEQCTPEQDSIPIGWTPSLLKKQKDIDFSSVTVKRSQDSTIIKIENVLSSNLRYNSQCRAEHEEELFCREEDKNRPVWIEGVTTQACRDRRCVVLSNKVRLYQALVTDIQKRCEMLIGKHEKDVRVKNIENTYYHIQLTKDDENVELIQFRGKDPKTLLAQSSLSSQNSKNLISYVGTLQEEEVAPFVEEIIKDLKRYIEDPNTCYVIKYLIKSSDVLCNVCSKFISVPDGLLEKEHTKKLIYTLSNHYPKFRDMLTRTFKVRPLKYVTTLPGAILLSLVMSNTPDISSCEFIYKELKNNPDLVKTDYFSRALATYMQRCPKSQLEDISKLFEQNIQSLMHDNFGNYLLQIFFDRNCISGIEMTEAAILKIHKKVFLRKYSRFVLLRAIQRCNQPFLLSLLDLVLTDKTLLQSILPKTVSASLLLYCIAQCPSILLKAQFLTTGVLKDEFKPEDCCKSFDFFQELDHLIEIGVYPQNFT